MASNADSQWQYCIHCAFSQGDFLCCKLIFLNTLVFGSQIKRVWDREYLICYSYRYSDISVSFQALICEFSEKGPLFLNNMKEVIAPPKSQIAMWLVCQLYFLDFFCWSWCFIFSQLSQSTDAFKCTYAHDFIQFYCFMGKAC